MDLFFSENGILNILHLDTVVSDIWHIERIGVRVDPFPKDILHRVHISAHVDLFVSDNGICTANIAFKIIDICTGSI